jgi:hypothetical protein
MSQDYTPARTFLLKLKPEQVQAIDEYRWNTRQNSQSAAVRKLIDLGLAAARAGEERPHDPRA